MGDKRFQPHNDRVPGKEAGSPMRWSDYRMVQDGRTDGSVAPADDIYGTYRRNSGRVCGDGISVELNTGRTGTTYGPGADSTRVQPGRDKTTPDDTVYKKK